MRFRVGKHSPVNVWLEQEGEPDVQWAMATDPQRAATLVRLANAGLAIEPEPEETPQPEPRPRPEPVPPPRPHTNPSDPASVDSHATCTPLVVFEHTRAGIVARCLLCGDQADPVTNPPWHGQHIRTRHPQYVTWEPIVIPEFDEHREKTP